MRTSLLAVSNHFPACSHRSCPKRARHSRPTLSP